MKKIRIVTATTTNQVEFWHQTLLGQSLSLFPHNGLEVSVFHNNKGNNAQGLSQLYNSFLQVQYADEILVFVHDDVYIHDWHLAQRLEDAMVKFDVIGLAGNSNPDWDEPSWLLAWDRAKHPRGGQPKEFFSGVVAHRVNGHSRLSEYGPTPRACKLLDGLFLAVNAARILDAGVCFDPQFAFHFYDLDFCRQCVLKGLKIGTWPISVTHGSIGAYNSASWKSTRDLYFKKWQSHSSI